MARSIQGHRKKTKDKAGHHKQIDRSPFYGTRAVAETGRGEGRTASFAQYGGTREERSTNLKIKGRRVQKKKGQRSSALVP